MLAALGGRPLIDKKENLGQYPPIGANERQRIATVLETGILWGPWAPMTRELEQKWSERIGVKYCAALNSGTAALHCALGGCGLKLGDEVIVPAYSFIATASTILMVGAIPIFVDIQNDTGNIDPELVEAAITHKTKAILVVHLHGLPADMDRLREISDRHGLYLIEDCAQAHGATYRGKAVGSLSDVGAFSLNATKVLAGPEGGLLTTSNEAIFNRAAKMRVFGTEWREGRQLVRDADSLGYNYRTNELMSAFALARLESFDVEQEIRISNAKHFIQGIMDLPGISVPSLSTENKSHIYQMIRLRMNVQSLGLKMSSEDFRDRILIALTAEGANWWVWEKKPLPAYSIFQTLNAEGENYPWCLPQSRQNIYYHPEDYPVSLATAKDSIFTTAHFPPCDRNPMDLYIQVFRKVWDNLDSLSKIPVLSSKDGIQKPF
jgi:perosamine synthetase